MIFPLKLLWKTGGFSSRDCHDETGHGKTCEVFKEKTRRWRFGSGLQKGEPCWDCSSGERFLGVPSMSLRNIYRKPWFLHVFTIYLPLFLQWFFGVSYKFSYHPIGILEPCLLTMIGGVWPHLEAMSATSVTCESDQIRHIASLRVREFTLANGCKWYTIPRWPKSTLFPVLWIWHLDGDQLTSKSSNWYFLVGGDWNHGIWWLSRFIGNFRKSQLTFTPSFFRGVAQPPTSNG